MTSLRISGFLAWDKISGESLLSVLCASDAYGQLLIGTDQGHLLSYSDGVLTTLYQIDKSIGSLAPLDANTILFASGNQLNLVGIPILVAPNDGGLPITVTEP